MAVIEYDVDIPLALGGKLTAVTFGDGQICFEGQHVCVECQGAVGCDEVAIRVYYRGVLIFRGLATPATQPSCKSIVRKTAEPQPLPPGNYRIVLKDMCHRDFAVVFNRRFYYEGYGYSTTPPTGLIWTGIDDKTWYMMQVIVGTDGKYWAAGSYAVSGTPTLYIKPDASGFVVNYLDINDWEYGSGTHVTFVKEEGDYWIFQVSAGMIVGGYIQYEVSTDEIDTLPENATWEIVTDPETGETKVIVKEYYTSRFGFEEFVKVSKSKLSDWIVVRILQYLATEHADRNAAAFLRRFGKSTSYPPDEVSRYCPRDPSYYGDLPDRVAGLKGYYDAMVEAANEAQQIYDDWVEWGCFHCKAKLAYSQYDYDMCVSEWQQKLRAAYQEYVSAKTTRDVIIEDLKLEPFFYCFLEAFPEYAEYMKDPPIQTTLPDCAMPLPKLRNVEITSTEIYFEYYAPIEMTVLICLGRVEDSTVRKIDCYELLAKPQWQSFSKEIHLVDGTYQLYFPALLDYVNPITKVVSLPNIRITNVRYTVQNDQVVIKADAVPSDTCSYEIGLYYDTGEVIATETFYLKAGVVNEITFTVSLDKVRNRKVCIAPVGVEDIYATFWEDIECVG